MWRIKNLKNSAFRLQLFYSLKMMLGFHWFNDRIVCLTGTKEMLLPLRMIQSLVPSYPIVIIDDQMFMIVIGLPNLEINIHQIWGIK